MRCSVWKWMTWLVLAAWAVGIADARAAEPLQVRVSTFNIRLCRAKDGENGWEHRKDFVAETIRAMNADLVGMQEAWPEQTAYLQQQLPEYKHLVRSREVDPVEGESTPIFYRHERWELDAEEQGHFWLSDTPEVPASITWNNACPRIVTWVRLIDRATGRGLYFYNTHLDHVSELARVRGAQLLAQRIAGRKHADPVIVTGDFNCGEKSEAIQYLQGLQGHAPVKLVDSFRRAHPDAQTVGTFNGFQGTANGEKIDYIFATDPVKVLATEIRRDSRDGKYPSDHFPMVAELVWE